MARITTIFEVKTETGDAVNDVKKLDKDMTHLADTIGVEVSGSISAMEDKLYELALAGQQNTDEFKKLQEQTARYKKIVIETDRSIDALAEQGRGLSNALAIAEGTVAGYQAFAGVSALLGDENEALMETMTKLQAAQGVLNSIMVIKQQLQEKSIALTRLQAGAQALLNLVTGKGTKAMKLFRIALASTGIGLLVVGIGLLITNFDKLLGLFDPIISKLKAFGDLIGLTNFAEQAAAEETRKKKVAESQKYIEQREHEKRMVEAAINDEIAGLDRTIKLYKAQGKSVVEVTKQKIKAQIELLKLQDQEAANFKNYIDKAKDFLFETKQFSDERAQQRKDTANKIASLEADLEIVDIEARKKANERAKAAAEKRKAEAQKIADELKRIQEEHNKNMIALMQEIEKEEDIINTDKRQRELNSVNDHYFELIEQAKQFGLDTQSLEIARDQKIKELQDGFAKEDLERERKAQEMINNNRIELIEKEYDKEREKITEKYKKDAIAINENEQLLHEEKLLLLTQLKELEGQALAEISKKYAEQEKQERIDAFNAYADTTINGLSAISSMNEFVSDMAIRRAEGDQAKQEKLARRAFNINKSLQLATATVQGIQAVQNAFTTASASPIAAVNPAYPFIQAGIAGVTSAVNIAKIASARFEGGGAGSLAPSGGASQGASASTFSISDNTNTNQTNLNPDGTVQGQGNNKIKVFVSETDITETQNNVQQINTLSTF